LLKGVCEGRWSVVRLSAKERLVSPNVYSILRNKTFQENFVLLGIDEAHIVVPWGKDFRQTYHQVLVLRRRLPSLVAVSATISPGEEFNSLRSASDLKAGQYIRESSERPDVRMVFKTLTHGLGWYQFPDLAWVFKRGVKVVV
jgi:superfamily II DNA helicase RecQ